MPRFCSAVRILPAFITAAAVLGAQSPVQIVSLPHCVLISGDTLPDCRIGFRVFGAAAARNGTLLVPTWGGGRSSDWLPLLGRGNLIDTTAFQVVVVDALSNGVSSSPSNTSPGHSYPSVSIEDMVASQYRVAHDVLRLDHLSAIVGVSMGGIQAFEWAASHPEYVDLFVSVSGSPRMTRHDRTWIATRARVIVAGLRYGVPKDTVLRILAGLGFLTDVRETINTDDPSATDSLIELSARALDRGIALEDWLGQAGAMQRYDFARHIRPDTGLLVQLRGRFLIVGSPDDRVVSYEPSVDIGRRIDAKVVIMRSPCGHRLFRCEAKAVGDTVRHFLTANLKRAGSGAR